MNVLPCGLTDDEVATVTGLLGRVNLNEELPSVLVDAVRRVASGEGRDLGSRIVAAIDDRTRGVERRNAYLQDGPPDPASAYDLDLAPRG